MELELQPMAINVMKQLCFLPSSMTDCRPQFIVPMSLACILSFGIHLFDPTKEFQQTPEAMMIGMMMTPVAKALIRALSSDQSKYNNYLTEELGSNLTANMLLTALDASMVCIEANGMFSSILSNAFDKESYTQFLKQLLRRSKRLLAFSSTSTEVQGYFLVELCSTDYQMKRINWCYRYVVQRLNLPDNDPIRDLHTDCCDSYLAILFSVLNISKDTGDAFLQATVLHLQLTAMLTGCCYTVRSTRIQELCNLMKEQADAASDFSPPLWRATTIGVTRKIVVETILPFFEAQNATSIEVYKLIAYLDLYSPGRIKNRVAKDYMKACACCKTEAADLLKCSGCGSVRYCDAACQKKNWKNHKKECSK
jgi:hypothetical protein